VSVSTLSGQNVVITGAVPDHTRTQAEALVSSHGAHIQKRVTKDTNVLIIGERVGGTKINAAKKWGTAVIPWSDALALMNGAPAVAAIVPPSPPTKRNQPIPAQAGYRQVKPQKCKDPEGATPEEKLPKSGDWQYEIKWDGYRAVLHQNGITKLASSGGNDYSQYEHIIEEAERLVTPCILDGELIVPEGEGGSNHERLHKGEIASVRYVVFDVLEAMGEDIRSQPLRERRKLLETILEGRGGDCFITASPVFGEDEREALLQFARDEELEGIVCKRAGSYYKEGARNGDWLKIKLRTEQEFVIVGWTIGQGKRAGTAGSFLLAVNDGTKTKPKWTYVGDVGSGGTDDEIEAIRAELEPVPGVVGIDPKQFTRAELKETTFVIPETVVRVKFQKWTSDGKLWHPSLQGVRDDKNPKEVTRAA
jgi:bifunctional non-homologous end joining protein LigD